MRAAMRTENTVFLLFHDVYVNDPRESGFASPAADRYKLSAAAFDRELAGLAAALPHARTFALTFDDGGVSFYTCVADRLEALGWRGYCLISTDYLDRPGFLSSTQVRELHRRGHIIGSHSASHPARIDRCSRAAIVDEWRRSIAKLEDLVGSRIDTASVPGGWYSRAVAESAAAAGVTTLFTSEPVCASGLIDGCRIEGRFTLRRQSAPGLAARLVTRAPWSRWSMRAEWRAKAAIKPVLGPFYLRVADWLTPASASNSN